MKWWLLLTLCVSAGAQITSPLAQFEVETTGNDTNAGCFIAGSSGTDNTYPAPAVTAYTDLVAPTTMTITSAAHPFGATSPGRCLRIISGTNWTPGLYWIVSVSGTTATVDSPIATMGATGGTGNSGGALATWAQAILDQNFGSTIWIKAGTYTITANIVYNSFVAQNYGFEQLTQGYHLTRGDLDGTQPLITSSTNGVDLVEFDFADYTRVVNLHLTCTAATRGSGMTTNNEFFLSLDTITIDGCKHGIDESMAFGSAVFSARNIAILNSVSDGWLDPGQENNSDPAFFDNIVIRNSGGAAMKESSPFGEFYGFTLQNSILANNAGGGFVDTTTTGSGVLQFLSNTFVDNTGSGFEQDYTPPGNAYPILRFTNNLFWGNSGTAISMPHTNTGPNTDPNPKIFGGNNRFGSNGANYLNVNPLPGDLGGVLDPFVSRSGHNWQLNQNVGAGLLVRGAGYPGPFPQTSTTGFPDVGAAQSVGGGGSSVIP